MVRIFVASRRPCDSDAFATSSYGTNFAQPLSAATFVSAAVRVVLPWSMCPMVPTLTCGLERSNFSLAMSSVPSRNPLYTLETMLGSGAVRLRAFGARWTTMPLARQPVHLRPSRFGGQPSPGLPTAAHALVGKRERRLE